MKLKKDSRILLQRILLKMFKNLKCTKHVIGKVTHNEIGDAYSNCRICGEEMTLVGKTLGEVDVMTLDVVSKLLPQGTTLESFAMSANERSGLTKTK